MSLEEGVRLVGDITPSYALLGEPQLSDVASRLSGAGFLIKPIFIMRDPLERMVSAFNMGIRRIVKAGGEWDPIDSQVLFWEFCQKRQNQSRTRYEQTIQALDLVFGQGGVKYLFFETLFHQAQLDDVCDFLGLDSISANFGTAVNLSPRRFVPTDITKQMFYEEFDSTYSFCRGRFESEAALKFWGHDAEDKLGLENLPNQAD